MQFCLVLYKKKILLYFCHTTPTASPHSLIYVFIYLFVCVCLFIPITHLKTCFSDSVGAYVVQFQTKCTGMWYRERLWQWILLITSYLYSAGEVSECRGPPAFIYTAGCCALPLERRILLYLHHEPSQDEASITLSFYLAFLTVSPSLSSSLFLFLPLAPPPPPSLFIPG